VNHRWEFMRPIFLAGLLGAAALGLLVGWAVWGRQPDYYAVPDPDRLPASPENDLIREGLRIFVDTTKYVGPSSPDPAMRFAGNNLACENCHINGGRRPYAAPMVSVFSTYPLAWNDTVITLPERINGCMTRSLNGRPMPENSPAMNALIAYIRYAGQGSPQNVRIPGMGLAMLAEPPLPPSAERGAAAFATTCANCHGADGQGSKKAPPGVGYTFPPLWGPDSFNAAAGLADMRDAAAYIRANMPFGATHEAPIVTAQQAWDIAAFVTSRPRPPKPGS
jgi:thiosulfate dehydrogenase